MSPISSLRIILGGIVIGCIAHIDPASKFEGLEPIFFDEPWDLEHHEGIHHGDGKNAWLGHSWPHTHEDQEHLAPSSVSSSGSSTDPSAIELESKDTKVLSHDVELAKLSVNTGGSDGDSVLPFKKRKLRKLASNLSKKSRYEEDQPPSRDQAGSPKDRSHDPSSVSKEGVQSDAPRLIFHIDPESVMSRQLVFDLRDCISPSKNQDKTYLFFQEKIKKVMEGTTDNELVIHLEGNPDSLQNFKNDMKKIRKALPPGGKKRTSGGPSVLADRALLSFSERSEIWKAFYQHRLRLQFIINNPAPVWGMTSRLPKMERLLLAYLFIVDMITTIVPKTGEKVGVIKSEIFTTALRSFEDFSKIVNPSNNPLFPKKLEMRLIWKYVVNWIRSDQYYSTSELIQKNDLGDNWKSTFSVIFALSIDRLSLKHAAALINPT
ncbi:hypothetical protein Pst134EA_015932 [Puccinia striiformis f. sp. tritici]|uniref:hypothetical protein n=1 Tax=Puccinia striiformis f. sp. tritici TaxID=168172 RepID=UPI00200892D4|nr:hypothetical protein Pst134EA_015932 [Puccinia striiformis f. sp. tritici]KAH9453073.1 hypothetical protein Pst134EB_017007 [Puccinia striiformis f. sp. tritici]KAH9463851.1 hypothetical protein Pst134EA_015932 [Puccinia striiformis f. sp. tritici]KAI9605356.1 hypothetical protein KEM48_002296 [Puccinia striiformis f. sp. tritici PST-130]